MNSRLMATCGVGVLLLQALGSAQAGEVIRIEAADLPTEAACHTETYPHAPRSLSPDGQYGRLSPALRSAAIAADPIDSLARATLYEYARLTLDFHNPRWGLRGTFEYTAKAFADLSISGGRSYAALHDRGLTRTALHPLVRARFVELMSEWGEPTFTLETADLAVTRMINRAFQSAWALRGPDLIRRNARNALGWIAVSGEDDRPDRPINVSSSPFPQRNIPLRVRGHNIVLRTVFMNPSLEDPSPIRVDLDRLPNPLPAPEMTGDVILFLHGAASSAEEASAIAPRIFDEAQRIGKTVTVLSLDLPGYGFSSTIDTTAPLFSTLPMETNPNTYLGLDFIEQSLDALVQKLDAEQPGFSGRIVGVIGGSLGGNLGLRLASKDRSPTHFPWVRAVIAWSPASVWTSFADQCGNRTDISSCWTAGLLGIQAQRKLGVSTTGSLVRDEFHEGKRGEFYSSFIAQRGSQFSIAGKWYSDDFGCKDDHIEAGKWTTGEYFSKEYLPWHWRMAHEQLIFSHWDAPQPLLADYRPSPKLLLMAGEDDNHMPERLYRGAMQLGRIMSRNYGRTLDLANTGHSVHAERPVFLAGTIMDFIYSDHASPVLDPAVMNAAMSNWP